MITNLLEQIAESSQRMKSVEEAVAKAVDHLDEKEAARFPLSPSAALKPMRDLYYGLVNYYAPGSIQVDAIEPRVKLTFKLGHMIEAMLVNYFREAFQLKDEQKRVTFGKLSDGTLLSGAIDWAVVINGETILMDSKSSGSYPFKLAPKEDNIAQMQLYMHSDWGRKNKVNKAILAYFNKDNSEIKCIQIDYNADLAEALLQRFYSVWDMYQKRQIPPREYVIGFDWQANYSNYRTHDFLEFQKPLAERDVVTSADFAPKTTKNNLRDFVLTYGSSIVDFTDKSLYVTANKAGVSFQEIGEKVWEAV